MKLMKVATYENLVNHLRRNPSKNVLLVKLEGKPSLTVVSSLTVVHGGKGTSSRNEDAFNVTFYFPSVDDTPKDVENKLDCSEAFDYDYLKQVFLVHDVPCEIYILES